MLKDIELLNEEELFSWEFDRPLLKQHYPSFYTSHENELEDLNDEEIAELLPSWDHISSVVKKMPAIRIHLGGGKAQTIYNTDIISWNGLACDGYRVSCDGTYLYIVISRAAFQAGSLGIWSVGKGAWEFTDSDEGLCVEAVLFIPKLNLFLGFAQWNQPMSPEGGHYFFIINENRKFKVIEPEAALEADWSSISLNYKRELTNFEDHYFGYDSEQSLIFTIRSGEKLAYKMSG